jgi:hypothetical protein
MEKVSAKFILENLTGQTIFDERGRSSEWNDHVINSVSTMINFNIEDKWASYICDESDPHLYEHAKLISSIFPLPKDGWMRLIFDGSSLN